MSTWPNLSFSISVVVAPIEKKPRQFFSGRMREPDGPHFSHGRMVGFTQLLSHSQGNLAMFAEKTQKILPRDKICLCGLDKA